MSSTVTMPAINEEIRDLFREIEEELRYRYVKYTNIYLQVLSHVLREKGYGDQADKLLPLPLFLEFGASNRVLVNLMSVGLSRTSSILLQRTVSLPEEMSVAQCRQYLEAINLARIAIPPICKSEILRLRGSRSTLAR